MFPKLNQLGVSKSCNNVLLQNQSQNLTPLRNSGLMTPNTNSSNIFAPQFNNSRYADKWIINHIDTNTQRILTNYKKDIDSPSRNEESYSEELPQSIKQRRKRMIIKSLDMASNSFQFNPNTNNSEFQPREKLTTPPNLKFQGTPIKKRTIKRAILYVEPNSQDLADQGLVNQSQNNNDEMLNSVSISTKDSIRSRQNSLQGISMSTSSDFSINKSQQSIFSIKSSQSSLFRPFFAKDVKTSIIINNQGEREITSPSTNDSEESIYNFTNTRRRIILPSLQKGILKNSSETNINSPQKRQTKKQVSFNLLKEFH